MKRPLYVGFSTPHDRSKIGATIIRWFEAENRVWWNPKSWVDFFFASHIFNIFPHDNRRPFYMVSEAAGSQVRFMSQMNFEKHAEVLALYKFEFDEIVFDEILTYSEAKAGTPYAFLENLGIAVVRVWGFLTGRRMANPWAKGDRAQKCSELVWRNVVARLPGVTLKGLSVSIYNETGEMLPADVDLLGVRDMFHILEFLADKNLCVRMDDNEELKKVG